MTMKNHFYVVLTVTGVIGILGLLLFMQGTDRTMPFFLKEDADEMKDLFFMGGSMDTKARKPLPQSHYKVGGCVIVTVVSNKEEDVGSLQTTLRSLAFFRSENPQFLTPVLVFHGGDLTMNQMEVITRATTRPIAFPVYDPFAFPEGFDPEIETHGRESWRVNKWYDQQVNRFLITGLWLHPAMSRFETVLKISFDSCFKSANSFLPKFPRPNLLYQSWFSEEKLQGFPSQDGLFDAAGTFLNKVPVKPVNAIMWQHLHNRNQMKESLPVFDTSVELISKSLMQRRNVAEFHKALTEHEPFGVFRKNWDLGTIRVLEISMFVPDYHVLQLKHDGYYSKYHCDPGEVEVALATFINT